MANESDNSSIRIIYGNEKYFRDFYQALKFVAAERVYLERLEPSAYEVLSKFHSELISKNAPVFYALDGEKFVGWCDVSPIDNPRMNHRGNLGMGLLPEYRGKGIGGLLLKETIQQSKTCGLEKIELTVYANNLAARKLYQKFGFHEEGIITKFRKLDDVYYDGVLMAMNIQ